MRQILESNNRRLENENRKNYVLAKMTAAFIGCGLAGKPIPEYDEIFVVASSTAQKEKERNEMLLYLEQFKDYANRHNQIRSGNGTKQ